MGKIAIHGFGRIGRSALKAALKDNLFVPAAISDIKDLPTLAALFEVDSNYVRWSEPVKATGDGFNIGGRDIKFYDTSKSLPDWGAWRSAQITGWEPHGQEAGGFSGKNKGISARVKSGARADQDVIQCLNERNQPDPWGWMHFNRSAWCGVFPKRQGLGTGGGYSSGPCSWSISSDPCGPTCCCWGR